MENHIVIVGAGLAGLSTAEALRMGGYTDPITVLGAEPYHPYHRPPLSKAWLSGETATEQLTMRAEAALQRKQITIRTGTAVIRIEPAEHGVVLGDGSRLTFSGLVLATGATPRALVYEGLAHPAVQVLRSRDDAHAVSARLKQCVALGLPVVIVGGGFIGLEVAATARKLGLGVTVLEAAPRLLGRVLVPELSHWYARLHQGRGAELVLNAQIDTIRNQTDELACVRLADGRELTAGLVLVGIGVTANDELAREAGVHCEGGIVVDARARTSEPDILAAGDCAVRRMPDGKLLRLESVQNATEQGRTAAATLLGLDRPMVATPWFWSDQYDKKLQIAGLSQGADSWAVRGDMQDGAFSIYHFQDGQLIAVDSINATKEHLLARQLLAARVSPTADQVADPAFDLASLLPPK